MNKLKWWFRIVGGFYFLLGLVWSPLLGVNKLAVSMFPGYDAPAGGVADRFLFNVGAMLGFEWLVMGAYMIYAARNPAKNVSLVWLIVGYELVRGILDDVYLIIQGYPAGSYIAWIVVHTIIITTAVISTRQAQAAAAAQSPAAARA
ncbi:MAG: BphX family protein [Chloroflexi bacterium]|nr:BphX family protein [Chloroflexota bacterium]